MLIQNQANGRLLGKPEFFNTHEILQQLTEGATPDQSGRLASIAIAEDRTCPLNSSVTDSCPSGSMPGIMKRGRNSCIAGFWVHQRW
jgi:hypothetical protein